MRRVALVLVVGWLLLVPTGASADVPGEAPFAVSVATTRSAFSPDADGRADDIGVVMTLEVPATVSVWVEGRHAETTVLLADAPLPAGATELRWSGVDVNGAALPDGPYRIRVDATDATGGIGTAETEVVVDTRAPTIAWETIAPDPFRGSGDVRFSFRVRDRAAEVHVRARVVGVDGRTVAIVPATSVATGARRLLWDGMADESAPAATGLLSVRLTVRDDAGNVRASRPRTFRDHRPVAAAVVRRVEHAGGRVALTFDDCYDASAWSRILDVLASRHSGASFFCLGPAVLAHASLARRTVAQGHTIGGHGWDHADLRTLDAGGIASRVLREEAAWWRVARATPVPFFRPSYGEVDAAAVAALGREGFQHIVLWDVDPWDWTDPGPGSVTARVLSHVRSGSIVVLHVRSGTAAALPGLIDGLRRRGLEPVTLLELLGSGRS